MERIDLEATVKKYLDSRNDLTARDGFYEFEIYADYRDEIGNKEIEKILESDEPRYALEDSLREVYENYENESMDDIEDGAIRAVEEKFGDISEDDQIDVREYVEDHVSVNYPLDHYLKQNVKMDILIDTGDGNSDFTLNTTYPAYGGSEELDPNASLRLLAALQGYSFDELKESLKKGDVANPNGFLDSVRQEVANETSNINILTCLVTMTLDEAIKLAELVKKAEKTGNEYYPYKRPDCGTLKLGKDTTVGLYDPWNGAGSVFEITLEKDVNIPIKYIRSALPDGSRGNYSIDSIYGMCGSAWTDTVLAINPPKEVAA